MFFYKNKDVTAMEDFPCLTLNVAPTVIPLPGIVYKLTFEKTIGENILGYFKNYQSYQSHFLLTEVDRTQQNQGTSTTKTVNSFVKFQDNYDSKCDEKSLYLALVPPENCDPYIGCISRVTGVLTEETMVTISFRTLTRATVDHPLLNSGNQVWTSCVKVVDDSTKVEKLTNDQLRSGIFELSRKFNSVNDTINSFKRQYKQSMKQKSSQHLLLLSPLSNTLFFQLNKANFNKAWSIILGYIMDLKNDMQKKPDKDTFAKVLNLVDLVVAILPTSVSQKWSIMSALDTSERISRFKTIMQNFEEIFGTLYSSTEYVQQYFEHASNLEKSRLIANQLKSLKAFIDDVKSRNNFTSRVNRPENNRALLSRQPPHSEKGDPDDDEDEDEDDMYILKKFLDRLPRQGVHPDGLRMLKKDMKRLAKMNPQNSEYQVLKNYFDIITDIPFGQYGEKEPINVEEARQTLDKDHYGLQMVKRRLLEYLCVLKLQEKLNDTRKRAPILLLVGPPGVGKTSIAKSVAQVLNRRFQRVSLGGIHNEAEIRGHRRTYVGSMCGLIINALRRSACMNPLILLDEVDKVLSSGAGSVSRINGDPSAALLEVLDPEQNNTFMDHYVGFPVDLSQVLFFCTANDLGGISMPLLDRMEIIEIPGYTPEEKIQIGSKFLLPKQIRLNGLDECHCGFQLSTSAWESLVLEYTREPGVRSLERQLAAIVRHKVMDVVERDDYDTKKVTSQPQILQTRDLFNYLGFPIHPVTRELLQDIELAEKEGVVNGLSYNSDGTGSVLVFEVIKTGEFTNANGPTILSTGNLGNVLQESINIAKSLVKALLRKGVFPKASPQEFLSSEYHLHVPAGAISKDGPSAGSAITLAFLSMALKRRVTPTICMTGEITLRGKILPIGGLKEKLLGAKIYGMKKVLIPLANRPELVQAITDDVAPFAEGLHRSELDLIQAKMDLQVVYVDTIYDVIKQVWPDIIGSTRMNSHQHQEERERQRHQSLSKI